MRNKIGDKLDGDQKRDSSLGDNSVPLNGDNEKQAGLGPVSSTNSGGGGSSYSINGILGMRDALTGITGLPNTSTLARKRSAVSSFGMLRKNE